MKKLVLYSSQNAPDTDVVDRHLLRLTGKTNPVIGYIPSCADPQRKYFRLVQNYYGRHGFTMQVYYELDEDHHPEMLDKLLDCDAIHLSGGNTHAFLYWLRMRGMIEILQEYAARGGVQVGVSAGAILMTMDIAAASIYRGDEYDLLGTDLAALQLADFAFLPHLNKISLGLVMDFSRQHPGTVYGCPDVGGIIVEDDRVTLIGDVLKIVNGGILPFGN